jgi:hypothetical protein
MLKIKIKIKIENVYDLLHLKLLKEVKLTGTSIPKRSIDEFKHSFREIGQEVMIYHM